MSNYKIKVNNEAESKEAQELFKQIGCGVVNHIDSEKGFIVASKGATNPLNFDYWCIVENEITLPQLRDLVVLHRNDMKDATHDSRTSVVKGFLSSEGVEYIWNYSNFNWDEFSFKTTDLKPIHKQKEQGLISGKEALIAMANGEEVEYLYGDKWLSVVGEQVLITALTDDKFKFRLKPRTITLNVEIPGCGTKYKHGQLIWVLNSLEPKEYCSVILDESDELPAYWWESEEEIKQVVAALRGALK